MYTILHHPEVVARDIPVLNQDQKERIKTAIEKRLATAPCDYGKPLRGGLKSVWTLRVGDYRILYLVDRAQVVVLRIAHRKDAYDAGVVEARRRGVL